jgi:hypothetical protein
MPLPNYEEYSKQFDENKQKQSEALSSIGYVQLPDGNYVKDPQVQSAQELDEYAKKKEIDTLYGAAGDEAEAQTKKQEAMLEDLASVKNQLIQREKYGATDKDGNPLGMDWDEAWNYIRTKYDKDVISDKDLDETLEAKRFRGDTARGDKEMSGKTNKESFWKKFTKWFKGA